MGNNIINKKIKILNQEYLITKLLGKGFFGDVFEGKNMNTNKFVAIKIINTKKVNEAIDNIKYNFKRIIDEQIDNMNKLKSHNTCELLNYYEDKNYFYLITKIYDTNLIQLFKEKFIDEMPIKNIKEIFFQLLEIFKKIDDFSIIHGNINMEKILINYDNEDKTEFTFVLNTFSLRKYLNYNKLNLSKINREDIAPEITKGKEFDCKVEFRSNDT
jgi:serine/threonine protein kinase